MAYGAIPSISGVSRPRRGCGSETGSGYKQLKPRLEVRHGRHGSLQSPRFSPRSRLAQQSSWRSFNLETKFNIEGQAPKIVRIIHWSPLPGLSLTPGATPSMNSTPASSKACSTATRLLDDSKRVPFSKSLTARSLKFERAPSSICDHSKRTRAVLDWVGVGMLATCA